MMEEPPDTSWVTFETIRSPGGWGVVWGIGLLLIVAALAIGLAVMVGA